MKVGLGQLGGVTPPTTRRSEVADHGFAASLDRLLEPRPLGQGPQSQPLDEAPVTTGVRFSRHASARLSSRMVEVSEEELEQLSTAVDRLDERGARESLVLLGDNAYVVGVPSRTVVTVMPRADAMGTVFTNIDSTFVAS
ncbi:MAG: hypothetical protein KC621_08035 [Myxococcales bacterium]|nr:hypothetical protein [Myxococcales bacterium]